MSKYLILGDLHCRSVWKDIVAKEGDSSDRIIFLGDYLPPRHDVQLEDPTDACGFLYDVLDFKDKNPNKVVLLRGNHDCQVLGYSWAECYPKAHPKVEAYCRTNDVKNWFLNNTQWVYRIPNTNIVCSHAGIGNYFLDSVCKYFKSKDGWDFNIYDTDQLINHINEIPPCELFAFNGGWWDTNGDSATQPCTWIRPETLINNAIEDVIQVIGHTPVSHIANLRDAIIKYDSETNCPNLWCCDCLENRECLIIEDGIFKPCKI